MGLDIYLFCFRNCEPATFERKLAEEILSRGAIDVRTPLYAVNFADGRGAEIFAPDEGAEIDHLSFGHCGGSATFLDRVYELAERTRSLVIWHFGSPLCAVTHTEDIPELPLAFREAPFGPPFVVTSGRGIYEAILCSARRTHRRLERAKKGRPFARAGSSACPSLARERSSIAPGFLPALWCAGSTRPVSRVSFRTTL